MLEYSQVFLSSMVELRNTPFDTPQVLPNTSCSNTRYFHKNGVLVYNSLPSRCVVEAQQSLLATMIESYLYSCHCKQTADIDLTERTHTDSSFTSLAIYMPSNLCPDLVLQSWRECDVSIYIWWSLCGCVSWLEGLCQ